MPVEKHILEERIYCPLCGKAHRAKSKLVIKEAVRCNATGQMGRFVQCRHCKELFAVFTPDKEEDADAS